VAIGPVQLIVLGFQHPEFHGEIIAETDRLKENEMLEHQWAIPLRDAIGRAGGFRISDGFISPLDLVEIGLLSAEEARQHHAMETTATATAS
jgi:hypothetical protein